MFCKNCGKEIPQGAVSCGSCGTKTEDGYNYNSGYNQSYHKQVNDNPSHFAGAVSCCFPVVGLILYFLWKDEKPDSAKLICNWMIGGVIAWVLFYVLMFIIGFAGAMTEL